MEETNSSDLTEQAKHITIIDYLEKDKIKKQFINCVNNIINDGKVENIDLSNVDLLKKVFNDSKINDTFCKNFEKNFSLFYKDDMMMKSQDFVYNLNLLINDVLIPYYETDKPDFIIDKINELSSKEYLDLYSAVSYDNNDLEIIEDFKKIVEDKEYYI